MNSSAREPSHTATAPTPKSAGPDACDLCGDPAGADDFNPTAGMTICPCCLEDLIP